MSVLLYSEIVKRLNTKEPRKKITILPHLNENQIGDDGIDLRLSCDLLIPSKIETSTINPLKTDSFRENINKMSKYVKLNYGEPFILHPGEFILGNTFEYICLPEKIAAILHGRSCWGRFGLIVHATAGLIHPTFHGVLTFELTNVGPLPITLYPLMRIAQIIFYNTKGHIRTKKVKSQFLNDIICRLPTLENDYDLEVLQQIKEDFKPSQNQKLSSIFKEGFC